MEGELQRGKHFFKTRQFLFIAAKRHVFPIGDGGNGALPGVQDEFLGGQHAPVGINKKLVSKITKRSPATLADGA